MTDINFGTTKVPLAFGMMAARDRVFGVYELLEQILLSLSLSDLLIAMNVSQEWRFIILNAPSIRTRLLSDPISRFLRFDFHSEADVVNMHDHSAWFFRTLVANGTVVILRTKQINVQLLVPNDVKQPVQLLDGRRTQGASRWIREGTLGWAEWYSVHGTLTCFKHELFGGYKDPQCAKIYSDETIWHYLQTFNCSAWERMKFLSGKVEWRVPIRQQQQLPSDQLKASVRARYRVVNYVRNHGGRQALNANRPMAAGPRPLFSPYPLRYPLATS